MFANIYLIMAELRDFPDRFACPFHIFSFYAEISCFYCFGSLNYIPKQ